MKTKSASRIDPATAPPTFHHINGQLPPEAHTAMYVWHKYWSRKTWNVVAAHIQTYTAERDIVLDPFAGSGVVAIEAARCNRRAIVCDFNPAASNITELTLKYVSTTKLLEAFERVRQRAEKAIAALYTVKCLKCAKPVVADCFVRRGDSIVDVRYKGCPHCGHREESGNKPKTQDLEHLTELEAKRITDWYPTNRLYYPDGEPFKKKEKYDSLDQLFTKRNLRAAALLNAAIDDEGNATLREFLRGAFVSMIHLCTRMMPVCEPAPSHHATYFSSPGWTQHTYWSAPEYMEQNVWDKFEGAVTGHQGLINAKNESNQVLGQVRVTNNWRDVLSGKADIAVITADCLELMKQLPEDSVDYIFTDPPYDASVQYGELSYLWNAWLKQDFRYTEKLIAQEIVRNERQKKPFDVYHALLNNSFQGEYRVLKRQHYMTLTFHNPTFKVRNATVHAGVFAGFDYEHIHHQPTGRVSAKSLLQPFGSAQGDFYLRFGKAAERPPELEEITEERFRRIVIETCKAVIAERAEPTPYTILINQVDPVLAKRGLFGTLNTGLDVKTVLEEGVGKQFQLVDAKLGGVAGKLWWFADKTFAARLQAVPLTERVEATVFRCLHERGRVTFTEVWESVAREFPNSLTSDSTSIAEALELYGSKVSGGAWMLREEIRVHLSHHSELIALLAQVGKHKGYEIWIGQREQREMAGGLAPIIRLKELVTAKPSSLVGVSNLRPVLDMDLLWLSGKRVVRAFEVESTTTMTSGLQRGSNLPREVPKTMVIPEARHNDFQRKFRSPLFSEHFTKDNWSLLFFDALREAFTKRKTRTEIESLFGKKRTRATVGAKPTADPKQHALFGDS